MADKLGINREFVRRFLSGSIEVEESDTKLTQKTGVLTQEVTQKTDTTDTRSDTTDTRSDTNTPKYAYNEVTQEDLINFKDEVLEGFQEKMKDIMTEIRQLRRDLDTIFLEIRYIDKYLWVKDNRFASPRGKVIKNKDDKIRELEVLK